MNQPVIGQFIPGNSLLHRMDPRSKLLFVLAFMFVVFLANNAASYGLLLAFIAIGVYFSRISPIILYRAVKPIFFLLLLTSILHLWMTKGGDVLLKLPFVTIYEEGVRQAVFISVRFFLLMAAASLLTFTTSPIDLTDGMERLIKPLERVGVPAHELALMMSIALRFIPTLWEETEKIKKAQMSRGADFESGHVITRVKSYIPVFIPLFISAFRRAEDLALAMEARGYRGGAGRTKFRELRYSKPDGVLLVFFVAMLAGLWVLRK
ncbi:energy-coupling factor transporter transmembrane component T family protein [Paenactinomyces guangxiensis]|uniref:Energy-coupling factor transporter transmembrane protein EcfT n=1 Tax=Paenactinomyces guangxiensis TaxID=1490290 RepID=A0A7W2A9N3_9BACL|nr:energy-coupling factor transporter transmembrane component T [Paenactinomyces guangxiensis]MBA4495920.1 energy-coupling factor transporter transmembrane protein EcfT [Paenactinomyces guangxiensis]MBH8592943.1 energy-coupling factor transporter transmembrane protein EcfT [Paenactinomyces guangxiensis]